MIPFARVLRHVRVDDAALLRPDLWTRSGAGRRAGVPDFLTEPFLRDALAYTGVDREIRDVVQRSAARIRREPLLCRLADHLAFVFHDRPELRRYYHFRVETPALGDCAGMLPLLPLLAGTPHLRALHRKLRVPRRVVTDTLFDIAIWTRHNRRAKGRWGFDEVGWMMLHFGGTLYRLGRLQFAVDRFHGRAHAFRHRPTGRIVLLASAGVTYRADGRVDGTNGIKDARGRWTSRLSRRGGTVIGHPISLTAHALRDRVALPAREWQEVLQPGDPILDMHIPALLPLDEAAAMDSCRRAPAFFRARFPRHRPRAMVCYGWLMDAAFQQALPPTANMLKFQSHFHLYPMRGRDGGSLWSIFGKAARNLKGAPRDSGLRRNVLDFYAAGGRLLGSGGGIWKDLIV